MKFYRVQSGDTLESIAVKYNTTVEEILKYNKNLGTIAPGQTIVLPRNAYPTKLPLGIPQDAIVVQTTQAPAATTPAPTITPPGFTCPLLGVGSNGMQVSFLQQRLKNLGYDPGPIDGEFGPKTLKALKDFQTAMKNIAVTGTTSLETWKAMGVSCGLQIPAGFNCQQLQEGSRGEVVKLLQTRLKVLGYSTGAIDGIFGPVTKAALQAFQKDAGLNTTGVADKDTWEAMGFICPVTPTTTATAPPTTAPPTTAPPTTPTPTITPPGFKCPLLGFGSTGTAVTFLQQRLKTLGYDPGPIDGIFGRLTLAALESFQRAKAIAITGTSTQETWLALGVTCPALPTVTPPPTFKCPLLSIGSKGSDVIFLQNKLFEAGFNPGPVDGIFGKTTLAALQNFQRSKNIPVTDSTNLQTWLALGVDCGLEAPPSGFNCPLLKKGSTGDAVKFLQKRLVAFGFDAGPVDGIFGQQTQTALTHFQQYNKELEITGTTTIETWTALGVTCPVPTTPAPTSPPPTTPAPTGTPLPTPTPPPGFDCPILSFGRSGDPVEFLQLKLKALGYDPGPIDGIFGSLTESALKAFQTAKKLSVTGTTTIETWQAMDVVCATPPPTTTAPPPTTPLPTPTPPPDFDCPLLLSGSTGDAVEFLQIKLEALGYDLGTEDGTFGPKTEQAVKDFQRDKNLTVTGTTTVETWQAMAVTCPSPAEIESLWFYVDTPQAWSSLQAHYRLISALIPFWYPITANGEIVDQTNTTVLDFAKANNIPVYALIHNFTGTKFDADVVGTVLADPGLRTRLIANILQLLGDKGLQGINIDFEFVPPAQRANYTKFLEELYTTLHAAGYVVTVDVAAKEADMPSNAYSGAFDYSEIWRYADEVILLTQDEHYLGFAPGPIASIPWVSNVVNYALSQGIPKNKVKISIPVYGYDWETTTENGTDRTVSAPRAAQIAEENDIIPDFDNIAKVPHFKYTDLEGNLHEVWYENAISFAAKIDLVYDLGLAGFAAWRLGLEDPGVWDVIDTYI